MKKLLYSVSTALLLLSCNTEDPSLEAEPGKGGNMITFVGRTFPETRTEIGVKDGNSYPVLWSSGDRIGIIGAMGSGKSTLAKLLTGFYQPQKGSIKFGDVDLRQLPTTELRGRIGVLPQDVVLFYGSIRENIVLGDPTINDHLVFRAAALAGVTDFVRNNPAGFAAQVGEQGKALSGGQRQAVALARALVRDPEVLILDEPTSNMDTDSEQRLQQRLAAVSQGRTLILVTHRLSMLRMVDKLAVMENGRLRMFGPRDAILKRLRDSAAAARKPAPEKGQEAPGGAAAVKEGKDGRP